MSKILYENTQKMSSTLMSIGLVIIVIFVELIVIYTTFFETGDNSMPIIATILITLVMIILTYFAIFLKMKITVTEDSISIKTVPTRFIKKDEVEKAEIADIKALRQYGGWGMRYTCKKVGYIPAGAEKGVYLHMKDGRNIMISSKDPDVLLKAINQTSAE